MLNCGADPKTKHKVPHLYSRAEENARSLTRFGMTILFLFRENSLKLHRYQQYPRGSSLRRMRSGSHGMTEGQSMGTENDQ
jgi:hypothetical protein